MIEDLRPCLFCESPDPTIGVVSPLVEDVPRRMVIVCTNCGCHGPRSGGIDDAIRRWNGGAVGDVPWNVRAVDNVDTLKGCQS